MIKKNQTAHSEINTQFLSRFLPSKFIQIKNFVINFQLKSKLFNVGFRKKIPKKRKGKNFIKSRTLF